MIKKITPLLILCFTVGIIASCSSSDPLISEAEDNIKSQNYDGALAAAEKYIEQNPQKPQGYYYKGVALTQKAQAQQTPAEATEYYKQMNEAFEQSRQKVSSQGETPDELNRISPIKDQAWRQEHNSAVELATDDSLMQATENHLDKAVAHLTNSTIIRPDSAMSWQVLAQVNSMRKNYEQAAKAQEKYIEIADNPDAKAYSLLAQFYRLNEQPKKTIEVLENARQQYPDNAKVAENLADSYSQDGQSQKALAIIEELVEQDPSNPRYRLSLGTRLYQTVEDIQSDLDDNVNEIFTLRQKLRNASGDEKQNIQQQINALKQENSNLRKQIDTISERALNELNATIENQPDEAKAYDALGIIYQNKAAVLYDQRNLADSNKRAAEFDKQAQAQLRKAMKNFEKATEIDPDNQDYWLSLFKIYTQLGMDEKAKEAEQKAGLK